MVPTSKNYVINYCCMMQVLPEYSHWVYLGPHYPGSRHHFDQRRLPCDGQRCPVEAQEEADWQDERQRRQKVAAHASVAGSDFRAELDPWGSDK